MTESTSHLEKLPDEALHLQALERMRQLEPYYRWILDLVEQHLGKRILDAGCGIGNFTSLLAEHAEEVVAADLSPKNVAVLRHRFRDQPNVRIACCDLEGDLMPLGTFDTIVMLDILEHLERDAAALTALREQLVPQGRLVIKVPAITALFGSIDEASGHFRRYSKNTLSSAIERAGYRVLRVRYMNVSAVAPYLLKSRLLRPKANFSRTFSERQLRIIRAAIPIIRTIDRLTGPPIGLSLVAVGEKSS
ncbi:MAG: class I SAM-dependent methyltransferase [Acidobacteria bacterium]|nr:MAG: class I SAM-dependent methyltransferase [Acidobacteriota bacterium]REK04372.1 MAG: class I SAM-dependent methyltransferase [Acidobacteriota bacterium]